MTLALHDYPDWQQPLATADLDTGDASSVASGNSLDSPLIDMRPYTAARIRFQAATTGVMTAFHPALCAITWVQDGFESSSIFEDEYLIMGNASGSGDFNVDAGRLFIQTPVLGPYLRLSIANEGTVTQDMQWEVIGSSRPLSQTFAREVAYLSATTIARTDAQLVSTVVTVAAGATEKRAMRLHRGLAHYLFQAGAQTGIFKIETADGNWVVQSTLAANAVVLGQVILPSQSCIFSINNTAGASGNFRIAVVGERGAQ